MKTSNAGRALMIAAWICVGCEQRTSDAPRTDDRSSRDIAALAQRITPLEQRANTLQGNVLFLSQQDEAQRAQLAQTQQQLAATQAQVQGMQSQARTARRQVQGMMQQQQQQQ